MTGSRTIFKVFSLTGSFLQYFLVYTAYCKVLTGVLFMLTGMLLGPYQTTKKVLNAGHLVSNFRIDGFPQKNQSTVDNCEVFSYKQDFDIVG